MTLNSPRIKWLLATAAAAVALLAPSTASAGLLAADGVDCDSQSFSQPFLPWADVAQYTLQPGGDFEQGRPWSGGSVVAGNEPFYVGRASDGRSLALAAGESTVSPAICVGIEHPTIRFFGKGSNLGSLRVDVIFTDGGGDERSLTIGVLGGSGDWALSPTYVIGANMLPLLPGGKTPVAFRVTATGGNWRIDDFYVDPYSRW